MDHIINSFTEPTNASDAAALVDDLRSLQEHIKSMSYGGIWVTACSGGVHFWRNDDFNAVTEFDAVYDLGQVGCSFEA